VDFGLGGACTSGWEGGVRVEIGGLGGTKLLERTESGLDITKDSLIYPEARENPELRLGPKNDGIFMAFELS